MSDPDQDFDKEVRPACGGAADPGEENPSGRFFWKILCLPWSDHVGPGWGGAQGGAGVQPGHLLGKAVQPEDTGGGHQPGRSSAP